jgi:hypothetical protein
VCAIPAIFDQPGITARISWTAKIWNAHAFTEEQLDRLVAAPGRDEFRNLLGQIGRERRTSVVNHEGWLVEE